MSRGKQFRKKAPSKKRIILTFLTPEGENAYHQVVAEGDKASWKDKKITNTVCSDQIISENPLIVECTVKIAWLADKCDLDNQIIKGLAKFGAFKDADYTMEVRY